MTGQDGLTLPAFFEYFAAPVKLVPTADGGMAAWRLSTRTGGWDPANDIVDRILFARGGEVDVLTRHEFVQLAEECRARYLRGDGPVYALYETMRAISEVAEQERRPWTVSEQALVRGLARRTFVMFEEQLRQAGDPGADPSLAG